MSVRRIMGTETEYAVSGAQGGNPVQWSFDVVAGASSPRTRHIRWDYRQEDPVNDMRGMRLDRASARADMLTDEPLTTTRPIPRPPLQIQRIRSHRGLWARLHWIPLGV